MNKINTSCQWEVASDDTINSTNHTINYVTDQYDYVNNRVWYMNSQTVHEFPPNNRMLTIIYSMLVELFPKVKFERFSVQIGTGRQRTICWNHDGQRFCLYSCPKYGKSYFNLACFGDDFMQFSFVANDAATLIGKLVLRELI